MDIQAIILIAMFAVSYGAMVALVILHNNNTKCYEKQIKTLKKQIDNRDRQLELQEFVIQTQSKMIDKLRG